MDHSFFPLLLSLLFFAVAGAWSANRGFPKRPPPLRSIKIVLIWTSRFDHQRLGGGAPRNLCLGAQAPTKRSDRSKAPRFPRGLSCQTANSRTARSAVRQPRTCGRLRQVPIRTPWQGYSEPIRSIQVLVNVPFSGAIRIFEAAFSHNKAISRGFPPSRRVI
jgi:hypothetical protein